MEEDWRAEDAGSRSCYAVGIRTGGSGLVIGLGSCKESLPR